MSTDRRGLLLVLMDPDPDFEPHLNRWYNEEHFPERLSVPGFLSGRRFMSAGEGVPKYVAMYDLASPDVLSSEPYRALADPSPWTEEVRKHTRITRNVYVDITPPAPEGPVPARRPAADLWAPGEDT